VHQNLSPWKTFDSCLEADGLTEEVQSRQEQVLSITNKGESADYVDGRLVRLDILDVKELLAGKPPSYLSVLVHLVALRRNYVQDRLEHAVSL